MSGRGLVVIEANEIPPRVIRWYADQNPDSAFAGLLGEGTFIETVNRDEPDLEGRELYPSQAWATVGTGVGFAQHQVYWYGDPKPSQFPFYWQLAAHGGKRVGIVGTLHSSPFAERAADGNIVFAIPDCFAQDAGTRPARYRRFQNVNLSMTRGSGRVVSARPSARDLITLATTPSLGVRVQSLVEMSKLVSGVATRRVPRERVRAAQFLLLRDMFRHLVRAHDPDLAVFFTNHVAAAMHRYWFALFPNDWDQPMYDAEWLARHRNEIAYAMDLLDRTVADLMDLCDRTGRVLVLCTAIGQRAATSLGSAEPEVAVVRDPGKFIDALGTPGDYEIVSGMVPQIGVSFVDEESATQAAIYLSGLVLDGVTCRVDRAAHVVTVSYHVEPGVRSFTVADRRVGLAEAGVRMEKTDLQRGAEHDQVGSLIVHGADPVTTGARVDARSIAPALLELLGLEPPLWHEVRDLRLRDRQLVTQ